MSPRRARRRPDETPRRAAGAGPQVVQAPTWGAAATPDGAVGPEQVESWPDGDWVIRLVPGAASAKSVPVPGM